MNITEALKFTVNLFEKAGINSPMLDAEILVAHILKTERYKLLIDSDKKLSGFDFFLLRKLIRRRVIGEPIAYITGRKEFYSIDLIITKDVLIPRPETEHIVDIAIKKAGKNSKVLDIGTGSGAIAIALKKNRPDLTIHACDISKKALKVARRNSEKNLSKDAVIFNKSNLFQAYSRTKFDMIISNPPYLGEYEKNTLQKEISFEPEKALFTNNSGKEVINRIISESKEYMNNNGLLILEFGNYQDTFIKSNASKYGFSVTILNDYTDFPRYAVLQ